MLSGSDPFRAQNFIRLGSWPSHQLLRNPKPSWVWTLELSTADSFQDWDYLQDLTFRELETLSGARDLRNWNFTGTSTSTLQNFTRNFTTWDYQMNFRWNFGLPDELSLELRIAR